MRKDVYQLSQVRDNGPRDRKVHDAYLDDVLVLQFPKKLDFTDGRHVETIFELADFNLLDSDFTPCRGFPACS